MFQEQYMKYKELFKHFYFLSCLNCLPLQLWWLISIVNSTGFKITEETHLWSYLWRCFWRDLPKKGRLTAPWAEVVEWMKMKDKRKWSELQHSPISASWLRMPDLQPPPSPAVTARDTFSPFLLGHDTLKLWAKAWFPSWSCTCQTFCYSNEKIDAVTASFPQVALSTSWTLAAFVGPAS